MIIRKETGVKVIAVATDHSTDEGREKIINACPDQTFWWRTLHTANANS
jgi:hypothetical protein